MATVNHGQTKLAIPPTTFSPLHANLCEILQMENHTPKYARTLFRRLIFVGLYRYLYDPDDKPSLEVSSGAIQDLSLYLHDRRGSPKYGELTPYANKSNG